SPGDPAVRRVDGRRRPAAGREPGHDRPTGTDDEAEELRSQRSACRAEAPAEAPALCRVQPLDQELAGDRLDRDVGGCLVAGGARVDAELGTGRRLSRRGAAEADAEHEESVKPRSTHRNLLSVVTDPAQGSWYSTRLLVRHAACVTRRAQCGGGPPA